MSIRAHSLLLISAALLLCTGKLVLLQELLALPDQAQTLFAVLELACLWLALTLTLQLTPEHPSLLQAIKPLLPLLCVLQSLAWLGGFPLQGSQWILQGSELVLLGLLAGTGLKLPQTRLAPSTLKPLFQGALLFIALRLVIGIWLARHEPGLWLHLLPCDEPLCRSLITGLQILPLLLLASALFHCCAQERHPLLHSSPEAL